MLSNNTMKFISATLLILALIGMTFAKYFLPNLDTSEINTVLLSLLTGLGVLHVSDVPSSTEK